MSERDKSMKRSMAMILALALTFSMAQPVIAAENADTEVAAQSTDFITAEQGEQNTEQLFTEEGIESDIAGLTPDLADEEIVIASDDETVDVIENYEIADDSAGEDTEEYEFEELLIDEPDPETTKTEEADSTAGEESIEVRYAVQLSKTEGGDISFVEKEELPPQEENADESISEIRCFAVGEMVEVSAQAADGFVLQELHVVSVEDSIREYELTASEQGYTFMMPEEAVAVKASFGDAPIPEVTTDGSTDAVGQGNSAEQTVESGETVLESGEAGLESEEAAEVVESEEVVEAVADTDLLQAGSSMSDASYIEPGQQCSGNITSSGQKQQWYNIYLTESGRITLTATANLSAVTYRIYDMYSDEVWSETVDANASTGKSSVSETIDLTAGDYYLVVERVSTYAGTYFFKFGFAASTEDDWESYTYQNNDMDSAEWIELNTTIKGQLAQNDEADFYEFYLDSPGRLTIKATGEMFEFESYIYDSNGNEVWSSYGYWNSTLDKSEISETIDITSGGYYYFAAKRYYRYTGDYSFRLSDKVPVTGVKLNKTSQTIAVGKTAALKATVSPSNATNKNVTWKSSNTAVATVSSKGVVTGKKAGTATITVTTKDGSKKATCKVTVKVPVTGVKLNKTSQTVAVGKTAALKATISPSNASNKGVTWKSSNTAVATVSSKGVVTGKKAGTATITVTTKDGSKKATCKVTVRVPVTGVKLNKSSVTIPNGGSVTLKVTVSPSNATNKKVTWKSSNTNLATVNSSGKVTAKANANGTVRITATTVDGKKVASCTVSIRKPTVTYRTHVQTYGWQGWKKNGAMSGTQGQAKRLEGINIKLSNLPYSGGITYRTHVQTYGWQGWRSNGAMSGTSGQAKRLEAIEIKLTGEMAKRYDVYYRVHAQHFGWMGWAKNGERSGTAGYAYRLEGIQIVLVKKGGSKPSTSLGGQSQWTATKFSQKKTSSKNYGGVWGSFLQNARYKADLPAGASGPDSYMVKDVTGDSTPELFLKGVGLIYTMVNGSPKLITNTLPDYIPYYGYFCGYSTYYRAVVYYTYGMDYQMAEFTSFNTSGTESLRFETGFEYGFGYDYPRREFYYQDVWGKRAITETEMNTYFSRINTISESEWNKL